MAKNEEPGYEQARDELANIASQLERGGQSLEESLALWEKGEVLAQICEKWLNAANERITPEQDS